MIFTLFIILLYEFNRENFNLIYNREIKIVKLRSVFTSIEKTFHYKYNHTIPFILYLNELTNKWNIQQPLIVTNDILDDFLNPERNNVFFDLLLLISPLDINVNVPSLDSNKSDELFNQLTSFVNECQASDEKTLSSFMSFLLTLFRHSNSIHHNRIEFSVHNIVRMVNFYL